MARIIAVTNQKGGVGKTTTAVNVSACLAEAGKKSLIIDLDPQGNATSGLGVDKTTLDGGTYDALIGNRTINDIIVSTDIKRLFVAPATMDLAGATVELVNLEEREYILQKALQGVVTPKGKDFDYIIIDCPPSLDLLTVNALVAADFVLIPVQCEFYALEGLAQLTETIRRISADMNRRLSVLGLLLTMYDGRTNLSLQVADEVRKYFKDRVFNTIIPRNVRLGEAPSFGEPITTYAPSSKGAAVYKKLAREVIKRVG